MLPSSRKIPMYQTGFSLVEIMVGLVIGLLATLVIMQVFATFEGQKRTTMGSADAQTNGSIALFTMQRDVQMAGFGLPIFDTQNPVLRCNPSPTITIGTTPGVGIFPLTITDGGVAAGASDSIAIRYANDGPNSTAGMTVQVKTSDGGPGETVDDDQGCKDGDTALISLGTACTIGKVADADLATDTGHVSVNDEGGAPVVASVGASLSCIGKWSQFEYKVVNNQLQRNDASIANTTPVVSDIINIQAQYGISAVANSNVITQWVDASAPWAAPAVADRNRIKAVHIAVVARNNLLEKTNVTSTCTTAKGTVNNGPCAWDDAALPGAAPRIDLSNDANWQRYRYRVYDTIVPLRNMIWSKNTL